MLSSQAARTAGWLTGLAAALWMTAGGTAGAATASTAVPASARAAPPPAPVPPPARAPPGSGSWTVYHGDPAGHGVATAPGTVDTTAPAWVTPALDGQIYGEPLVSAGRIYVATENDTVYALSAGTGKVAWSRHLATPVPASSLPCGDITPTAGITGTPVIDAARREIFVVADEEADGHPAHVLAGLSTATGRVEMTRDVDPPGADTAALLQRTGLNLAGGRVVFGFGGNDGDCATYRGRVVSVPETGGAPADVHRGRPARPVAGRGLDGRWRPGRRRRRPRLGQRRQRVGVPGLTRLRRQRFRARPDPLDEAAAVLRAGQLGLRQRT